MRILITGGAGFIGSNLVEYLLKNKPLDEFIVYDNLSACGIEYLNQITGGMGDNSPVKFVKGDILDQECLYSSCEDVDVIIHLAAHTDVVESMESPKVSLSINVNGTMNVLDVARQRKARTVVFASSNAVLGDVALPVSETSVANPISPYGAGKLACEALCKLYSKCFDISVTALRFANAYGNYSSHKTTVIAKMLKDIMNGNGLVIYGDGYQTRDYVHVQDIAKAIVLSIDKAKGYWLFQVGSGEETSVIDIAETICSIANASPDVVYKPERPGEICRNYSSIKKIKEILGFEPEINLKDGIKDIYEKLSLIL